MSAESIVKIGSVELTEREAFSLYAEGKYIVTYSTIYQLHYSQAQRMVYGTAIYHSPGMAKRGRFHAMTGKSINRMIGFMLVNE